ncbi:hypothetical protein G9A89_009139 [Geosiphon pyriformis]|nr:hypothetical protein G9A89_009139 [Geosiphon pyriformis]
MEQSSRQFQDFWNWFLNEHSAETYIVYTIYYFDQAYFEDNFEERNNSINQLLYSAIFEQQPPDFEYLNHQIHIWIAAHQSTNTSFETEEENYQTAPVFDLFSSESEHSTQTTALGRRNNTPLPLFKGDAQDPIEWLDNFERAFSQEINANAQQKIIKWAPANAREDNTSFTIQFETKFRTSILISKWHMELERRTQDPVDSGRNWTEEQKIHSFTKELRTDLSYALWPLLVLKDNSTMNMAIELVQRIEDNQRMHLEFTLPVFASAPVMASASQMAATSFAVQTQDSNKQLIDRLTVNFVQLLEPLTQAVRDNQQLQRTRFEPCFNQPQQPPYQRQNNNNQNNRTTNNNGESASQPEENFFFAFNLTNDNYDMNELAINTFESTRKKKKAKIDFILDPNKASKSSANNNEPPKTKVFKNSPKLEPPKIVQKSGPYSVVKDFMETPAHITFGQLMTHLQFIKDLHKSLIPKKKTPKTNKHSCQAGLADNNNVTFLICKAQVVGYFIDLILDSESSVSDFSVIEAVRQNVLAIFPLKNNSNKLLLTASGSFSSPLAGSFFLVKVPSKKHIWVSPSVVSTTSKSPKIFNNKPVNKLVFPALTTSTITSTTTTSQMAVKAKNSKKQQAVTTAMVTLNFFVVLDEIFTAATSPLPDMDGNSSGTSPKMGQDQPLAVLSDVVFSSRLSPIPVAKQFINPDDLKNWTDQIEMESTVPPPVSGAADSGAWKNVNGCQRFSGWVASNLVLDATFKIKMVLLGSLFQLLPGCIGLKSVLRDTVNDEVFLTTIKIARSSGVAFVSFPSLSVVLHDVSLGIFSDNIKTALGIFDIFSTAAVLSNWSVLVRKDSVRIFPVANQKKVISSRNAFKAKLVNLPFGCTAFEISNLVSQVGGHMCFISHSSESYQHQCFAVVIFDSLESLNVAVLKTGTLHDCRIW